MIYKANSYKFKGKIRLFQYSTVNKHRLNPALPMGSHWNTVLCKDLHFISTIAPSCTQLSTGFFSGQNIYQIFLLPAHATTLAKTSKRYPGYVLNLEVL